MMPSLWYLFIFTINMGSHQDIETTKQRLITILHAPLYSAAMQAKIFASHDRFHRWFLNKFGFDQDTFNLMTAEKSYRVQSIVELFFHTLPMIIVISVYSNANEWSGIGKLAVLIHALMFIKNLGILTLFVTQRCIDGNT